MPSPDKPGLRMTAVDRCEVGLRSRAVAGGSDLIIVNDRADTEGVCFSLFQANHTGLAAEPKRNFCNLCG